MSSVTLLTFSHVCWISVRPVWHQLWPASLILHMSQSTQLTKIAFLSNHLSVKWTWPVEILSVGKRSTTELIYPESLLSWSSLRDLAARHLQTFDEPKQLREVCSFLHRVCPGAKTTETPAGKRWLMQTPFAFTVYYCCSGNILNGCCKTLLIH